MKHYIVFLILLLLVSCKLDFEPILFNAGSVNTNKYIAIGDGYTAGVSSLVKLKGRVGAGINPESQENSYPNLLFNKFVATGGSGLFKQPLLSGTAGSGSFYLANIVSDACGGLLPILPIESPDSLAMLENISQFGAFNNLAIPLMPVDAIFDKNFASNAVNPNFYMQRIINNSTESYMDLLSKSVNELLPTFFTSWLGNSDVLNYAVTGGGYLDTISLFGISQIDFTLPGIAPYISSETNFLNNYTAVLDTLFKKPEIKGVLINIPNILELPYFTTLPTYYLSQNCSTKLALYYKTALDTLMVKENDLVLLPSIYAIGKDTKANGELFGLSKQNPMYNAYVLDSIEQQNIKNAINKYNNIIKNLVKKYNIAFFDMYKLLDDLKSGLVFDGIEVDNRLIVGGFWGLDGIHFSHRANAIIANKIIDEMNYTYQANISKINIADYEAIKFP